MNTKKISFFLLALLLASIGAYAQGNGMAGINAATKMVTSYFDPGTKLIYAIGAVVGLIGGRWYQGLQQVFQWRPRHQQDGCLLVWSLYLPHCGSNHPS